MSGHLTELEAREYWGVEPYYEDGFVTLYHGDALMFLPKIERVGIILTDPPYNLGIEYGDGTNDTRDDYDAWCDRWYSMLPARQRTVIFPGLSNLPAWGRHKPTAVGCWHIPGNPGRGMPWSFVEWEPFLYWGGFIGGSNVYRYPVTKQKGVGDHPCPKPLGLMRALLLQTTRQMVLDRVVLDPFAGSGTTLRAAKDLGLRAIGIEIEERWCDLAASRLAQEVLEVA